MFIFMMSARRSSAMRGRGATIARGHQRNSPSRDRHWLAGAAVPQQADVSCGDRRDGDAPKPAVSDGFKVCGRGMVSSPLSTNTKPTPLHEDGWTLGAPAQIVPSLERRGGRGGLAESCEGFAMTETAHSSVAQRSLLPREEQRRLRRPSPAGACGGLAPRIEFAWLVAPLAPPVRHGEDEHGHPFRQRKKL